MLSFDEKHTRGIVPRTRSASHDTLFLRARHLPEPDRLLVEHTLSLGTPLRQLAVLHRVTPAALRRKLRRLHRVLNSPCFTLMVTCADRLPPGLRDLAADHFLRGEPLAALANRHRLTLHQVRQKIAIARAILLMSGQSLSPERLLAALDRPNAAAIRRTMGLQLRQPQAATDDTSDDTPPEDD